MAWRSDGRWRLARNGRHFSRPDWQRSVLASLPRSHAYLGYSEGQNVKYELRTDETEPARLAEAAKELASIPVGVIVAYGTPASQAAQAATQTIPIVMVQVGDPVRAGLVASLAHPGGNVTGTSFLGPDLAAKRLQLLKQVVPSAVRVAILFNPNNASNRIFRDEIETATRDLGVSLI